MKQVFLSLLTCLFLFSCTDDDIFKDYTEENEQEILEYLSENNLTATKDSYGLYYIIDEPGTGLQPGYTDVVTVSYNGYYTNGTSFDSSDEGILVSLAQVISGWTIGIPYFKEGGSGKLIIPSDLAYGSKDYNGIPGGSVLVFDINLISVNYNKENDDEIVDYLTQNNLLDNAVKTESGLYYIIEEEGDGNRPTSTDNVTVTYSGYFTDDEFFDESGTEETSFNLQNVITGWQEGLTYFKEGSKGKLFIPSRLGYGSYYNSYSGIAGGSVLIFDIDLVSVN